MMLFNEQGKIENIVPVVRNDAHRIHRGMHAGCQRLRLGFLAEHKHLPVPHTCCAVRGQVAEPACLSRRIRLALGGGDDPRAKDYACCSRRSSSVRISSC
jgi:ribonuclease R